MFNAWPQLPHPTWVFSFTTLLWQLQDLGVFASVPPFPFPPRYVVVLKCCFTLLLTITVGVIDSSVRWQLHWVPVRPPGLKTAVVPLGSSVIHNVVGGSWFTDFNLHCVRFCSRPTIRHYWKGVCGNTISGLCDCTRVTNWCWRNNGGYGWTSSISTWCGVFIPSSFIELLVVKHKTNVSVWPVISPYSVNDSQLCSPMLYLF